MLKVRVIPCLDVHDGRVVKGSISSTLSMPEIRLRPRAPMMPRARMSYAFSTYRQAMKTATR